TYIRRLHIKSVVGVLYFFFFSSRRRHTRSTRDWSSDVCSSDLKDACRDRLEKNLVSQAFEEKLYRRGPVEGRLDPRPFLKIWERSEERRVGKECRGGRARGR